jgi:NAD(P)-dependent dehydrogenase (short-subunit alcohol dehydrogenase family)
MLLRRGASGDDTPHLLAGASILRGMSLADSGALNGKVAIITGAATGIGRASALLFARAGARLALVDVREPELARTEADVRAAGGEAMALAADLVQPDDCAAVVTRAVRGFGRLDVLLNNAGVGTMVVGGTVESISLEHWDLAQDVNVRAIYLVSRAAVPALRGAGGGAIVNIASVSAFHGSVDRPTHAYAASKGAVLALTRAMAASYGRDGIRVNAICPGTIRTRLTADIVERVERSAKEGHGIPLGRVGEPEDIARCALFLASDDAGFISGAALVADGGAMAAAP